MLFEVNRGDLRQTRSYASELADLRPGQVRLAIERFAFTTNNVTYAVAGDMLDYWGFFPTDNGWGRIPAMGLASIVESEHPDLATGGRYFGFYPMGSEVVIDAKPDSSRSGFRDVGEHRANHAAVYTHFHDVASDPAFRETQVDEYLLLWGMFMTSFLIDDYLADNRFWGAEQTLITSASSKTSIALASCLAERSEHRAVGLTSERNLPFVEQLDLYDAVITYEEIDTLDPGVASCLVDMAGSDAVRSSVHHHFTETLKTSLLVGATHWEEPSARVDLAGPTPEFFFAPTQSAKRSKDWGPAQLAERIAAAFGRLLDGTGHWLTVEHFAGAEGIELTYRALLEGTADPSQGFICSMDEQAFTSMPIA